MYCFHSVSAGAIFAAAMAVAPAVHANVRVGAAEEVERDVSGALPGQSWSRKYRGADIFDRESIRTETLSNAALSFSDRSRILMGPQSALKIDHSLFNSSGSAQTLMLSVSEGAVRWTSGTSNSSAYHIGTPFIVITVRGTTFDLLLEAERTTLLLREGAVRVCSVTAPQQCATLAAGEMIMGTRTGLDRPRRSGASLGPTEFASRCLDSSGTRGACALANPPTQQRGSMPPPAIPVSHRRAEVLPAAPRPPLPLSSGATPGPATAGCYQRGGAQVCCVSRGGRRACRVVRPPPVYTHVQPAPPVCRTYQGYRVCCGTVNGQRICRSSGAVAYGSMQPVGLPAMIRPPLVRPPYGMGRACGPYGCRGGYRYRRY